MIASPLAQQTGLISVCNADDGTRQVVKIGSVTLYVPREWFSHVTLILVDEKGLVNEPSDRDYVAALVEIITTNLNLSPHLEPMQLPTGISLRLVNSDGAQHHEDYLTERRVKAQEHRNFISFAGVELLQIVPGLYAVPGSEDSFRLGLPLMIDGSLSRMDSPVPLDRSAYARYRIAPDVAVRLRFDLGVFPPGKWTETDRTVQKFIEYLGTPD